jgi:hypothetical protein
MLGRSLMATGCRCTCAYHLVAHLWWQPLKACMLVLLLLALHAAQ